MAETSIDAIAIKVSSDASSAANSLSKLSSQLKSISNATKGSVASLNKVASGIRAIVSASQGANASGLNSVANAVNALKSASKGALSKSTANNIMALADASNRMSATSAANLQRTATALSGFKALHGINLSSVVSGLKELPAVVSQLSLSSSQLQTFDNVMKRVANSISRVSKQMVKLYASYSGLSKNLRSAVNQAIKMDAKNEDLADSAKKAAKETNKEGTSFRQLAKRFNSLVSTAQNIKSVLTGIATAAGVVWDSAAEYVEDQNLSATILGDAYESSYDYWNKAQNLMGIDAASATKYQGVFKELTAGMGVAGDASTTMSQQLTQLGYDLSSFDNITIEEAMQKIQSGISGELEPLRRLGYDLSEAKLQQIAYAQGIDKSVSSMTQAEKVQLRYYAIMTQITASHGDLARSLNSPQNSMRVLTQQCEMLRRKLGYIAVAIAQEVIPWVTALVKLLSEAMDALLKFLGINPSEWMADLSTVDRSSLENTSSDIDDITDSTATATEAAKEFKKQLMGFDEINNITDSSSSSSSSSSSGDSGDTGSSSLGNLQTYDFFEGLADSRTEECLKRIKAALEDIIPVASAVGAALAGFTIGKILEKLGLLKKGLKQVFGIALIAAGGFLLIYNAADALNNGIDFDNLIGMIEGIGLAVAGAALAFGSVGAGIALAIGGAVLLVVGFVDAWENGCSDISLAAEGIGTAIAAVGAFILTKNPIVAFAVAAVGGVLMIISAVKDIVSAVQNGEAISDETINTLVAGIGTLGAAIAGILLVTVGGIPALIALAITAIVALVASHIDEIIAVVGPIIDWINTNIIQPIIGFVTGLFNTIATIVQTIVTVVVTILAVIVGVFMQNIQMIQALLQAAWNFISGVFFGVASWFDTNVIQPVAGFFTQLGTDISNAFQTAWNFVSGVFTNAANWFNTNVIQPIINFFSPVANAIGSVFQNAWNFITGVFKNVGNWFTNHVIKPIQNAFNGIKSFINNTIISPINTMLSNIINNGLNGWIATARTLDIAGWKPFEGVADIPVPQIPLLAQGGTVKTGQMFVAREAGPEMVGTMGGSTTVANNDQIVAGISAGVANAMSQMMPYLARIAGASEETASKDFSVKLDGAQLARSINKASKRAGRALVTA